MFFWLFPAHASWFSHRQQQIQHCAAQLLNDVASAVLVIWDQYFSMLPFCVCSKHCPCVNADKVRESALAAPSDGTCSRVTKRILTKCMDRYHYVQLHGTLPY